MLVTKEIMAKMKHMVMMATRLPLFLVLDMVLLSLSIDCRSIFKDNEKIPLCHRPYAKKRDRPVRLSPF
jgi:hypothetical protein